MRGDPRRCRVGQETLECLEGLRARMMLHSLGVDASGFGRNADRAQEGFDDLVPLATKVGKPSSGVGKKDAAITALLNISLGYQPFQHLGDGGLSNAQALGNIDLTGLAAILEQVSDKFDIVLDELRAAIVAGLPKAFDLCVGVDQARFDIVSDILMLGQSRRFPVLKFDYPRNNIA